MTPREVPGEPEAPFAHFLTLVTIFIGEGLLPAELDRPGQSSSGRVEHE
jgi:hypothetical protein